MKNLEASSYAVECWEEMHGFKITEQLAYTDRSECYEVDAGHVFALDNGKFAVVIERGCSCYSSSDADVSLCDTKEEAMKEYNRWAK